MTQEITKIRKHFYTDLPYHNQWVVDIVANMDAAIGYVQPDGTGGRVYGYDLKAEAGVAAALYVAKNAAKDLGVETSAENEKIRTFDTGATRDTAQGKLSYLRILSPIALRKYVEYMNFHAKQSDGTMREPDNWKEGFPIDVYLDSLGRHLVAVWLLQQGFTEKDNHGPVELENALCGIIFNAFGWLHEILKKG